ncbi:hypothetical protein CLPUN_12080 [Clostridium puniceum]|uniref:N-acetyltransferase domain-containing protein n=1 Tax=Clostridium puniceum TaxID=29367 RepID=A0A1S8TTN4_9CLOT|nr:hypothetical protein CLPUN_12080 [Clostridium puniceum]
MEELETERLIVRGFKKGDWKDLYEYFGDEEVLKFEPYKPFLVEKCKEEAIRRITDPSFLAVCLKDTNKLIGNIYFVKQDFDTWKLDMYLIQIIKEKVMQLKVAQMLWSMHLKNLMLDVL